MDEGDRTNLHSKLVNRFGARSEAIYMFVLGFIAISVNGLVAWVVNYPLLFPR